MAGNGFFSISWAVDPGSRVSAWRKSKSTKFQLVAIHGNTEMLMEFAVGGMKSAAKTTKRD